MSAAPPSRRVLWTLSGLTYLGVFACFYFFEHRGLGIGHFYYIAIALAGLGGDVFVGAFAGVLATGLYAAGIVLNPTISSADAPSIPTLLRGITYVAIGALIGWFASNHRTMLAELRVLANRDVLTGLPNTRTFESAITRHLEQHARFGLLIGDIDGLEDVNRRTGGWLEGDRVLREVADSLAAILRPGEELARIGGDEFAVLTTRTDRDARGSAEYCERVLQDSGLGATFGWASFPEDGDNALSLYRAADERLYARKIFRGRRRGNVSVRDDARELGTV